MSSAPLRKFPSERRSLVADLVGRLLCAPFEEGGRRGYRFTGQGSYAEILPGEPFNACGDPGGIRTRDLDLERVRMSAALAQAYAPAATRRCHSALTLINLHGILAAGGTTSAPAQGDLPNPSR
jgi:hypothetical protein